VRTKGKGGQIAQRVGHIGHGRKTGKGRGVATQAASSGRERGDHVSCGFHGGENQEGGRVNRSGAARVIKGK